ncbi:hypothetical protein JCM10212_002039 [Sporobolomyces blumeae]
MTRAPPHHGSTSKREAPEQGLKSPKRKRHRHKPRRTDDSNSTAAAPASTASPRAKHPPGARRPPRRGPEQLQPSSLYSYASATSTWTAHVALEPKSLPTSLRLLTYNTWSSSPSHTRSQTRALLDLLRDSRADIVALQEVSESFETTLRSEGWFRGEWSMSSLEAFWSVAGKDGNGKGKKEGQKEGNVVLVRTALVGKGTSVGIVRFKRANNERAKAAIQLSIMDPDGTEKLRVLTSHYSSLPQNAVLRRSQYNASLAHLCARPRAAHSVLLADFNASSTHEFGPFAASFLDACPPLSPHELKDLSPSDKADAMFRKRPTFGALYPLVTPTSKPRKPRRIDRIYVSRGTKVDRYREVGDEAIEGETDPLGKRGQKWPSDHVGVGARITLG